MDETPLLLVLMLWISSPRLHCNFKEAQADFQEWKVSGNYLSFLELGWLLKLAHVNWTGSTFFHLAPMPHGHLGTRTEITQCTWSQLGQSVQTEFCTKAHGRRKIMPISTLSPSGRLFDKCLRKQKQDVVLGMLVIPGGISRGHPCLNVGHILSCILSYLLKSS